MRRLNSYVNTPTPSSNNTIKMASPEPDLGPSSEEYLHLAI